MAREGHSRGIPMMYSVQGWPPARACGAANPKTLAQSDCSIPYRRASKRRETCFHTPHLCAPAQAHVQLHVEGGLCCCRAAGQWCKITPGVVLGRGRASIALIQLVRRIAKKAVMRRSSSRTSTGAPGMACEADLSACITRHRVQVPLRQNELLGAVRHAAAGLAQRCRNSESGSTLGPGANQVVVGVFVPPAPQPGKPVRQIGELAHSVALPQLQDRALLTRLRGCASATARGA